MFLQDGGVHDLGWKAWPGSGDGEKLRWELKRILHSAGYTCRSHRTKVCSIVRGQAPQWVQMLRSFGWVADQCYGASMRALLPRPGEVNDDSFQRAEQEYWVTTKTVLALLLLWKSTRRDLSMRAQINAVASTFLQACAPVEACAVPSPQSASGAELAICEVGFDEQLGQCVCVSLYTADLEEVQQNDTPQVIFWHALLLLHRRRECPRIRQMLGNALASVATMIDASSKAWGSHDLLKSRCVVFRNGNGKRTRADPHVKEIALESAVKTRRATNTQGCLRAHLLADASQARRWREEALAALQAASRLTNAVPGIVSMCVDAAAIGNPAKELMLTLQCTWPRRETVVLPPQELGRILERTRSVCIFENE